jgi:hypothetical protein
MVFSFGMSNKVVDIFAAEFLTRPRNPQGLRGNVIVSALPAGSEPAVYPARTSWFQ